MNKVQSDEHLDTCRPRKYLCHAIKTLKEIALRIQDLSDQESFQWDEASIQPLPKHHTELWNLLGPL